MCKESETREKSGESILGETQRFNILNAGIFCQALNWVSVLFQDWIDLNLLIWQVYSDNIVYTRVVE